MTLQLDPYQILTLIFTLSLGLFSAFKAVIAKIDSKFADIDKGSKEENKEYNKQLAQLDRDLLALKADLPNQYQRRDDAIRNQTIIEAKIDGLANKLGELHLIDRRRRSGDE